MMLEPLVSNGGKRPIPAGKKPSIFGWWPTKSEILPMDAETGRVDKELIIANIVAGTIIGIRQGLSAVMTASLIFNTAGKPELSGMLGFGITMMWYSSTISALWYALFGRLQYGLIGINDVIGILWGTLGSEVVLHLQDTPERIPATQLAIMMSSTILTGFISILVGKLGLGKIMLLFPAPVTSGFLGSIGFFIFKSSLQMSSGTRFHYLWPVNFDAFLEWDSLFRVICMFSMLAFMWKAPPVLKTMFPKSTTVKKLGGLFCQLLPLAVFYVVTTGMGISLSELTKRGWTYPKQGSGSPFALWTTYSMRDADWMFVLQQTPSLLMIVMMSILCSMTGVLGISGKFPVGPVGDPAPTDGIDYDRELITVGWVDLLLGATGGIITFHRLGSTVQLRMDGGTHRIALMTCSAFCCMLFFSGIPIGHLIPRWFLGALFMNSAVALLQDALFYFRHLPSSTVSFFGRRLPSMQYFVTLACIFVAIISSPFAGIGTGLVLSIFIFLFKSSHADPVSGVTSGRLSVGRTKRPVWELQCLRKEGDRILMLFLQGQLFFGSADNIARMFTAITSSSRVEYCILSFARVLFIDASAAQQVKASADKAALRNCRVLFCHMNDQVFQELFIAKAFRAPDISLHRAMHAKGLNWFSTDSGSGLGSHDHTISATLCENTIRSPGKVQRRATQDFISLSAGTNDAFDTESDALDYCNDQLVDRFYYCRPKIEEHQIAYRQSCITGCRLSDATFESMNCLPAGTMERLRPYCEVFDRMEHYTLLETAEPALWFIFRGAVAMLDQPPEEALVPNYAAEVKGFTGRGGKRLRTRLTPGHVAGKVEFFLNKLGSVDKAALPIHQVSSRISGYAEIWKLTREKWDQLPKDFKADMIEMLIGNLADEKQHSYLIE
mmetsp:Transcript_65116/g.136401  ORF Transcript_65116/g.136401 Transcript_65116/m.136401 type:complete len:894 (-) Transcript_65116:138-2819(-)